MSFSIEPDWSRTSTMSVGFTDCVTDVSPVAQASITNLKSSPVPSTVLVICTGLSGVVVTVVTWPASP